MILPMKKLHILFPAELTEEEINRLQELGVVDVHSLGSVEADFPALAAHEKISNALSRVEKFSATGLSYAAAEKNYASSVHEIAARINELAEDIDDTAGTLQWLEAQQVIAKRFGGLTEHSAAGMEASGITVFAYKAAAAEKHPQKNLQKNIQKNLQKKRAQKISEEKEEPAADELYTHTECVWRGREESYWVTLVFAPAASQEAHKPPDVPASWIPMQLPRLSIDEITARIREAKGLREAQTEELASFGYAYHTLLVAKTELGNELAKRAVVRGARDAGGLTVVEGYAPKEVVAKIYGAAAERRWGLLIEDVSPDDENVPTHMRNIPPVRIIKPLFAFLDVDPGYNEFDTSFIFLFFMSIFTAVIIGDAGYGSLLFAFSLGWIIFTNIKKRSLTTLHFLCLWFSITTIGWGVITGNWFAYKPFAQNAFLSQFIIPQFSILSESSAEAVQLFAFRLGLAHLCIAHLWKAWRLLRSGEGILPAVNQLAQATLLLGLYFLVLQLLLGAEKFPMPPYALTLVVAGFGVVVLTSEQKRGQNVAVGAGKGLANIITLALGSISAFADIISYIRLYAVGLSGFAIAEAFNGMASGVMEIGGAGAIIGGIAVLGIGHTFNILMSIMAVIVHGVRLNMLEFSGHLGMEWTGRKYNPFKKKIITRRI